MRAPDLRPVVGGGLSLIGEQRLQPVRVRKPYAVEVAHGVVVGAEKVFRVPADEAEPLIVRLVPRDAVLRRRADIEHPFPEPFDAAVAHVALDDMRDEHAAVVRGHPFEGRVETGMEHEPVFEVVGEHVLVQHRALAQHRPVLYARFQHAQLPAQLGRRIDVVRADEQRVADPRPQVLFVAVAVQRHGADMDEFRLRLRPLDRGDQHVRADLVALDGKFGLLVRERRDDRRKVHDVVRARDERLHRRGVGEVAVHDLQSARPDEGGIFLFQFLRALFIVRQDEHAQQEGELRCRKLFQHRLPHVSRRARHGDGDLLLFHVCILSPPEPVHACTFGTFQV